MAVECRYIRGVGHLSVRVARQQNAELLKALTDGCDGLREVQVTLCGTSLGMGMGFGVGCIDAAAGKHIGARRKAGGHGASRHQHFQAFWAIAKQQNRGGRHQACRLTLGMKELGGSNHRYIIETWPRTGFIRVYP